MSTVIEIIRSGTAAEPRAKRSIADLLVLETPRTAPHYQQERAEVRNPALVGSELR